MLSNPHYESFLAEQAVQKWPPREDTLTAFRFLLTDSSVSPAEVAKMALSCATTEANSIPEYGDIWSVLMAAVERFPEQSDRLVDFTVALQQLPHYDGEMHELDGLAMHLAEFTFNHADHSFNETTRDQERRGFVNANLFTAKLYLRIPRPNPFGFFIGFGSQVLRKTLESAPWEKFHHPRIEAYLEDVEEDWLYEKLRDEELEEIDIRTLNGFVPAAAVWIEYCGKEIYDKAGSLGREIPAWDKWTGPEGWSKERWAFWKKRFEWISTVTALDRTTRRIATNLVEQMTRIERGEDGII
ncbi:hypothetical protein ANOM_006966 [Aspergillus nomiae NRRL 13137]|uniref:Uncharacterized protein n=1 Tax=Aspergillus nomiae NRRL (strain ATCC 15546 / NRRL 13137 / CBS 260.88 / M93) TaxID=1509407 RepID=A0A0L1J070_ASPN3|nr:uncharacterized protein ANOM_006966 [Aspergillus nomiae NRRL 13137]KNG85045.1 hypothetical protein ANOM_006966 [Aspergillus nomiae NRRL 13137]